MSSVLNKIFGKTDKSAQKKQVAANDRAQEFIEQQMGQARSDLLGISPVASANRNMGFQGALDVLGQSIPQQFDAFQQGNVGAQQALLAGLPQVQNAILGLPTDMSGFQPQQINYNTDWAQQQLPDFQQIPQAGGVLTGAPQQPQQPQQPPGPSAWPGGQSFYGRLQQWQR